MLTKVIRFAIFIFISALLAAGQETQKNEIGFLLGAPVTPAIDLVNGGKIESSSGLTYQATFARRLLGGAKVALYFEVPFLATPQQNLSSNDNTVPANYASLFITPGLRFKLAPDAALSPWFSVGGGYANYDVSKRLVNGEENLGRRGVDHRGAAQFGAGLDVRTPIKILFPIGLRVEVRDFYAGKPNYNVNTGGGFQHSLLFSGGFTIHF